MRKLNKKKVRWIIREMEKGEISAYRIAKIQKISQRYAWMLYRRYQETGEYPYPKRPGRKPRPITEQERKDVKDMKKEHPLSGACTLERLLRKVGKHIPHNRIHRILKEEGLAKDEPRKQKRRKWVRYERRHSNSLWHTDWFEYKKKGKSRKLIPIEDDASRFVVGWGEFKGATAKNGKKVLKKAIKTYGTPKQVMTDNGTHFKSLSTKECPDPEPNEFQKTLEAEGITHVKSRVNHPQSNGKVEKAGDIIMNLIAHFGSAKKAIEYYNFRRPHGSLNQEECETPFQAYVRKIRPSTRRKFVRENRELVSKRALEYLKYGDQ